MMPMRKLIPSRLGAEQAADIERRPEDFTLFSYSFKAKIAGETELLI